MTSLRPISPRLAAVSIILVLIPVILLMVGSVTGLPRFSAEYGMRCGSCHVDPSGGGMRTEFGNQEVAGKELTLEVSRDLLKAHKEAAGFSEVFRAGFDARYSVDDGGTVERRQTDLYLSLAPVEYATFVMRVDEDGISENFGLIAIDDARHYLKIGRFEPAFGLRLDDTLAYVRTRLDNCEDRYLNGAALGTTLLGATFSVEAFNVNEQDVYGLHLQAPFRLMYFRGLLGASYRGSSEVAVNDNGPFPVAKALFGGLSAGPISVLGEMALLGKGNDSLATYSELSIKPMSGVYLNAEYEFIDCDRRYASGVEESMTFSLEIFPIPFVEVRPSYQRYTKGPLKDEDHLQVQLHLGY